MQQQPSVAIRKPLRRHVPLPVSFKRCALGIGSENDVPSEHKSCEGRVVRSVVGTQTPNLPVYSRNHLPYSLHVTNRSKAQYPHWTKEEQEKAGAAIVAAYAEPVVRSALATPDVIVALVQHQAISLGLPLKPKVCTQYFSLPVACVVRFGSPGDTSLLFTSRELRT